MWWLVMHDTSLHRMTNVSSYKIGIVDSLYRNKQQLLGTKSDEHLLYLPNIYVTYSFAYEYIWAPSNLDLRRNIEMSVDFTKKFSSERRDTIQSNMTCRFVL